MPADLRKYTDNILFAVEYYIESLANYNSGTGQKDELEFAKTMFFDAFEEYYYMNLAKNDIMLIGFDVDKTNHVLVSISEYLNIKRDFNIKLASEEQLEFSLQLFNKTLNDLFK